MRSRDNQPRGAPGGTGPAPGQGTALPPARRGRLALAALACAGLLLAAYANSFHNAFHFDDAHVVVNNLYLRSLRNVPAFFADARTYSGTPANMAYRPLVSTSLALDYALAGGLSPPVFHASQLLLMAVLGALLFGLYLRVMDRARGSPWNPSLALFAATLFCVHTLNTETLNLMHVRSEILSAAGLVAAFLVYESGRASGSPRRWLALPFVALGALAKAPAVLLAPLLFAWELLLSRSDPDDAARPWTSRLRRAAVAAAPAALAGVALFVLVERVMCAPTLDYAGPGAYRYALTQCWAWVHYLRLFFLPIGLSADTDLRPIEDWYDTRVVAGALAVASLAWLIRGSAGRRERLPVAFGLAWFAIGLLPASSVLPLPETINEHRSFLANIGLTLAVVWAARLGLERLPWPGRPARRAGLAALAGALVLSAHAVGTHVRNRAWRTGETLWADVTTKSPGNGRAWMNYGVALMARGELARARTCFDRALQTLPAYPTLHVNLGVVHGAMGDQAAAERHFRRAAELGPGEPASHYYYARWLVERGRGPEALAQLETAIRLSPGDENARRALLDLRAAMGDDAEARRLARELLSLHPDDRRAQALASGGSPIEVSPADYAAYLREGLALGAAGKHLDSALAYRAALALEGDGEEALDGLGWTLGVLGFYREAIPVLERAIAVDPRSEQARAHLGWVKGKLP